MFKKVKEYMEHPYTRGDYWGAVGVVCALYALIGAGYVVYVKIDEWKNRKNKNADEPTCCYTPEDEA